MQIGNQENPYKDASGTHDSHLATEENQTNGNQITMITDSWGDKIGSTMVDQLMVAEPHRLCGGIFNGGTPDSNFYEATISANASAGITNGVLDLTVTADSGSSIIAETKGFARYRGACMNAFRAIVRYGDTGKVNNKRYIGVCNNLTFTDGFFFLLDGTTFKIGHRTAGSEVTISNGSFNGEVTNWNIDTYYHTFEILYTNKIIEFYIDGVFIHQVKQTDARISATRHFRAFGMNVNAGVGSACSFYADSISISQYGTPSSQSKDYFQKGTTAGVLLKSGPGSLHGVIISGVTNNSVVTLYDGTSTAGVERWSSGTMTNQTVPFDIDLNGSGGMPFEFGLFLVISAANCNCLVKYE